MSIALPQKFRQTPREPDGRWRLAAIRRRHVLTEIMDTPNLTQSALTAILKKSYQEGFDNIRQSFMQGSATERDSGPQMARKLSYLTEQIIRLAYDGVVQRLYPNPNPSTGEVFSIAATGGFGRGEMAPYSDVDLLFLIPHKSVAWTEQAVEAILYVLWDIGLKVGHAVRTPDEAVRLSKEDLTIRTAFIEGRHIIGDNALYQRASRRFLVSVVRKGALGFTNAKLAERSERHRKLGDSRFVVEPNIKDGKGALRDLHILWWIARFTDGAASMQDLKSKGILSKSEYRRFTDAHHFLWTVRCAMHYLAGRAEERLSFTLQPELAAFLGYREAQGLSPVERFMKHYFLVVKDVGDLTRVFCTALEAKYQKEPLLTRLTGRRKRVENFVVINGRLALEDESLFSREPQKIIRAFRIAQKHNMDIHPTNLRYMKMHLKKIDSIRDHKDAVGDFLKILTGKASNETWLRRMNEAGVLGRFVPDFGRVVAQMQFDMYHHFTVDEHTIRAVGLLGKIDAEEPTDLGPAALEVFKKINRPELLYIAVFLHDIAKGRGGDHSVLGAEIANEFCPRFGFGKGSTSTVAWLVLDHLLMSSTAFKRDIADPKTVDDFVERVSSPERLRLLYLLTMIDIHAVGPGTWNDWKAQLLSELYQQAEERLVAGYVAKGREDRVAAKIQALQNRLLDWDTNTKRGYPARYTDAYWLAEDTDTQEVNARLLAEMEQKELPLNIKIQESITDAATLLSISVDDHPGVFARLTGAIALSRLSIASAKIHTTRDGIAVDNFFVRRPDGTHFDANEIDRLKAAMLKSLKGQVKINDKLREKLPIRRREENFDIAPFVVVDNKASNRSTVIEVNAKDRPGLLYDLVYALYRHRVSIFSAHIATYGEKAVDVFYVRDLVGQKITSAQRLRSIESKLLSIAETERSEKAAQSKIALR